ncbi:unnamed protein product [Clonostachys solani]|uniref:Uncharacterized protein n=1 Tax=Clonostachys solani TaxID=160281 RepID=A0A9P0ELS5_9HYPO|nr:unnamed protein product [Clonostachys solani]
MSFLSYTSSATPHCLNCLVQQVHSLRTENQQFKQTCSFYTEERNESNRRMDEINKENRYLEGKRNIDEAKIRHLEQENCRLEEEGRPMTFIVKMQKEVIEHQNAYIQAMIAGGNGTTVQDPEVPYLAPEPVPESPTLSTQQLMDFDDTQNRRQYEIEPSPKRHKRET